MKRLILPLLFASFMAFSATAQQNGGFGFQQTWTGQQAGQAVKKGDIKSLSEIYNILRKKYGGKDTGRANLVNGDTYHIRWETAEGRVLDLVVDARTGKVK